MERFEARAARREAALARAVEQLRAFAAGRAEIREIIVFGSYARKRVGPTSDLDVLIVRETDVPRSRRGDDLLDAVREPVGIDMIVVTPAERRDVLPATSFGRTILDEGVTVYAA